MEQWTESYSIHKLVLGDGLTTVSVGWVDSGYEVRCGNVCLKKKDFELEEGKAAGLRLAEKMLSKALEEVNEAQGRAYCGL